MPRALALLFLFLFLGNPAALCGQTQHGSWSSLNNLKAGQGIEVIETSMKRHAGNFVAVTDELLTLREKGSDVSLKREDVARVSTSSGAKRGEHALIGLVIGGAIGAGIGAASGSSTGFLGGSSRGIAALVGIVIGAPSGAIVGAVVPAHTTIYRAAPVAPAPKTTSSSGSLPIRDCDNTPAACRKDDSQLLLSQPAAALKRADSSPAPLPLN
jgi:hypothetical protein